MELAVLLRLLPVAPQHWVPDADTVWNKIKVASRQRGRSQEHYYNVIRDRIGHKDQDVTVSYIGQGRRDRRLM
jgi:hypothetical protein